MTENKYHSHQMNHCYDLEVPPESFLEYVVVLVNIDKGKILTIDFGNGISM